MDLEDAFGQTLRELRRKTNLSQETLALECGVDRTYISLMERGLRQPTLRTIFKLSRVLNVAPSELVSAVERKIGDNSIIL